MTSKELIILAVLATVMLAAATTLGNWSATINPDGILPHQNEANGVQNAQPRDAYWFGASIGLLGTSLLYCCIAMGLLILARTKKKPVSQIAYWIAGLAASGFILSYLVDDYFYG